MGYGYINKGGLDGERIATFNPTPKITMEQLVKQLGLDPKRKVVVPGHGVGVYDDLGNVYGVGGPEYKQQFDPVTGWAIPNDAPTDGSWRSTLTDTAMKRLADAEKMRNDAQKAESEKIGKYAELAKSGLEYTGTNEQGVPQFKQVDDPTDGVNLGVPRSSVYDGLDKKVKAKILEKEFMLGSKSLEGQEADGRTLAGLAQDAKRFQELNAENDTGGINGFGPWAWLRGQVDPGFQEMDSISSRLVPKMREAGSGSTSDFDAKMFQKATLGVGKNKAANDAIAGAMIAKAQIEKDRLNFANTYLMQNKTLRGANEAWQQYLDANPIFDPKSAIPALNPQRMKWDVYFSGGGQQQQGRPPLSSFEN